MEPIRVHDASQAIDHTVGIVRRRLQDINKWCDVIIGKSKEIREEAGPVAKETVEDKIRLFARLMGISPAWALAVAKVESNMGKFQKSPTGARGVFQMTTIAMKDLLLEMEKQDDDLVDIVCGIAFLRLLKRRWKSEGDATRHFCDPNDRDFYVPKVLRLMKEYEESGELP